MTTPMVRIQDLSVEFGRGAQRVRAVRGVSFDIAPGEALGLVGESGSGKSTLGRALIQLIQTSGGSVQFEGQELVGLSQTQMRPLRRQVQMVFQDPSLNPRQRAGDMLAEVLSTHGLHTGSSPGAAHRRAAAHRRSQARTREPLFA